VCCSAGITLQSGLVVDLQQLQQQYQGQCCLPRSVLNDNSALLRIDNSDGRYFVSLDPSCATPLTSDVYPVVFEYIAVGCTATSSSGSSGNTYVINGGALQWCLHARHQATCSCWRLLATFTMHWMAVYRGASNMYTDWLVSSMGGCLCFCVAGATLVSYGGSTCDPFNLWSGACWVSSASTTTQISTLLAGL
jgi:hypothetical protein